MECGMNLKGKICVLTGGAGVLGSALAQGLAAKGVRMALVDLHAENAAAAAENLKKEFSIDAIGIGANCLDKSSIEAAREKVVLELGEPDILINGAGGNAPTATTAAEFLDDNVKSLDDGFFGLKLEGFEKVFDLNFMGTLLPTMVFARGMVEAKKGSILNISSMNSFRPLTKIPAYSAAKAAINNFTQWLAVHFAKSGVRVNAIAPGFFLTQQNRFLLIDEKSGELTPRGEKIISATPMGSFGEPEHLVGTMLYLVSDLSSFVTGVVVPVDGGFSAYSGV